jgi:signal peptidase II
MKTKIKLFFIIVIPIFVLDQFTKWLIVHNMYLGESIPVIPNIFDIVYVTNKGAAFGVFAQLPDHYRIPLFYILSTFATVIIVYYLVRLPLAKRGILLCLYLILGGACGNLYDRMFRGEVVDFLSFHWYNQWANWQILGWKWSFKLEWPSFNVADMAISLATILLMILILKGETFETNSI